MSFTRRTRRNDYYLDVSDFVLSDPRQVVPSPRRTPVPMYSNDILTPSNVPIIIEIQGVQLSPYFELNGGHLDIQFYDFTLQVPEDGDENFDYENENSQQNNQFQDKSIRDDVIIQEPIQESVLSQIQQQNQIQISRFNIAYFNEVLSELKKIKATTKETKEFVFQYLTNQDLETVDLEKSSLNEIVEIALYNLRFVGPISWLQRKCKVDKYIMKKKRRIWKKKISYDCRKRVADNRLRVKGKFVTKKQACNILGVDEINEEKIKLLLEAKTSKSSE